MFSLPLKYWHTLRHLKPVQFHGRLTFRYLRPTPDLAPALPVAPVRGSWAAPAARDPGMAAPGVFELLGVTGNLAEIGWDGPQQEKLWRYNQHYFDDLNARGAAGRRAWHAELIADWIARNPPGQGTGWEPYPTSLRIVNWIKWHWSGNVLPAAALHSLAVQARWLCGRLEWHLLGNHLFCNAKALVFAGLAFEGREADAWLARGLAIIARQLPEQVLADGGNFERSPMYHAIFLEDMLDLLNATLAHPQRNMAQAAIGWRATGAAMLDWLAGMTHPDGGFALFNDAALNIAPTLAQLQDYAARLELDPATARGKAALPARTRWPDSGYVRLDSAGATAFLDVAPIGPDYLPGHAHADTLSFELSLFGHRVVVNGGTSCYGVGPVRLRERQTASHSTLEIDGQSSSEVWGGFRVARRAYPFGYAETVEAGAVSVSCSHDGYARLPGRPVHRRTWTIRDGQIDIEDRVTGTCRSARARYILHPDVRITARGKTGWSLALPGGQTALLEVVGGDGALEAAHYAPAFGEVKQTSCVAVDVRDSAAIVRITWG